MKKFLAAMLAMALCLVTFGALAQAYEPDRFQSDPPQAPPASSIFP